MVQHTLHSRRRTIRDSLLTICGRHRGSMPSRRLRFYRKRGTKGSTKEARVESSVWTHGHANLAILRDSEAISKNFRIKEIGNEH